MHWFDGFGGMWMMILWWIVIIAALLILLRYVFQRGSSPNGKTAMDILKERYARGEISKEEFEEKKKDILN